MTDRTVHLRMKLFPNEKGDKPWFRNGKYKVDERIVLEPGEYEVSAWKGNTKSGAKCVDIKVQDVYVKPDDGFGASPGAPQAAPNDAWE